jgi:thiamine-triphosphatase
LSTTLFTETLIPEVRLNTGVARFLKFPTRIPACLVVPRHLLAPVRLRPLSTCKTPTPTFKLEVERKFLPNNVSLRLLDSNNALVGRRTVPVFNLHAFLGTSEIYDLYYDTAYSDEKLRDSGIYMRQRNGIWQAKIRKSEDFVDSVSVEVQGERDVTRVLDEAGIPSYGSLPCLRARERIHTTRKEYRVEGFRITIDTSRLHFSDWTIHWDKGPTSATHLVGEVVLCEDVEAGNERQAGQQMDSRIEASMDKHRQVFP